MNINQSMPNFQAKMPVKKLVPLSNYKGPILQLTPADQVQIAKMQDLISALKNELVNTKKDLKNKRSITDAYKALFKEKIKGLEEKIANLTQAIREVKINRINQQRQEYYSSTNKLV